MLMHGERKILVKCRQINLESKIVKFDIIDKKVERRKPSSFHHFDIGKEITILDATAILYH